MELGHDVLWTDGRDYYTTWDERFPMTDLDDLGHEVQVLDWDGSPASEVVYHTRVFGDVHDRKTAIKKFREWHERR